LNNDADTPKSKTMTLLILLNNYTSKSPL